MILQTHKPNMTYRILAFLLVGSILLSEVGVARINHFCRVAKHQSGMASCEKAKQHDCCKTNEANPGLKSSSCCTTEITLFRAELNTVLTPSWKISVSSVDLFPGQLASVLVPEHNFSTGIPVFPTIPAEPPGGKSFLIQNCLWLI